MSEPHEGGSADDDQSLAGGDAVTTLLAEITDADRQRLAPPQSIWDAIVATIAADREGRSDHTLTVIDVGDGSAPADKSPIELQATTTMALARRRATDQPLPVVAPPPGPSRRPWLPVAAAVAVTIVGGLATWALSDELARDDGGNATAPPEGEVLAVAEMTDEGLPEGSSPVADIGEARLVRSGGRYYVDLDLDLGLDGDGDSDGDGADLPAVDGYFELWVRDPRTDGVLSLGVVVGDGRFALPPNLDPADFPVVEMSVEPIDGDPAHSGRSVWRGRLDP